MAQLNLTQIRTNLIQISNKTLINPAHISHIAVRAEQPPENNNPYKHEYPVYRITMYDGAWYDIAFIHEYPNNDAPFDALRFLLGEINK